MKSAKLVTGNPLLRGRRGTAGLEAMMNTLIDIIIAIIVSLFFVIYCTQSTSKEPLERKYLARGMSILTLLSQHSPGQLQLEFSPAGVTLSKYNFEWLPYLVKVSSRSATSGVVSNDYPYLWNTHVFSGRVAIQAPNTIYFSNTLNRLNISGGHLGSDVTRLICPKQSFSPNSIFLDPGHGEEEDTGFTAEMGRGKYSESLLACSIADCVRLNIKTKVNTIYSSRNIDGGGIRCSAYRRDFSEIRGEASSSDLVLSFHVGNYSTDKNYVKAYVALNKGFANASVMACRILNSVVNQLFVSVDAVAVIPFDPALPQPFSFELLAEDVPLVVLELGSLQSPISVAMLTQNSGALCLGIAGGILG